METLVRLCGDLRLPLKLQTLEVPSTELTFLGIVLDTKNMHTQPRLRRSCWNLSHSLQGVVSERQARRENCSPSLVSFLMQPRLGRIFLRRMLDTTHKAKRLNHWVHLTEDFRSDLAWWHCFIESWNGLGMMSSLGVNTKPDVTFKTDASGKMGLWCMLGREVDPG